MIKFLRTQTACSLLLILIVGHAADPSMDGQTATTERNMSSFSYNKLPDKSAAEEVEDELESELELKRMLLYVTPLMGIFQKKNMETSTSRLNRRMAREMFGESRKRGAGRRPPMYNQYNKYPEEMQPDRSGYGGGYSSSSGYGGGSSYGGRPLTYIGVVSLVTFAAIFDRYCNDDSSGPKTAESRDGNGWRRKPKQS
ncbi:Uncharacterized protein APZ42_015173 [Daphnia magna]|uniref:Uncharacterized protein n=1 Tax=Daphnia magna TaxID=35525 RepID=A0A162P8B2_9CRUS|nr:Uncharacterized protein APZ42_015173 [Daphnia magna]